MIKLLPFTAFSAKWTIIIIQKFEFQLETP